MSNKEFNSFNGHSDTVDSYAEMNSDRTSNEAADFIKYLLQGSGTENSIDYAALRKELEAEDSDVTSTKSHVIEERSTRHIELSTINEGNLAEMERDADDTNAFAEQPSISRVNAISPIRPSSAKEFAPSTPKASQEDSKSVPTGTNDKPKESESIGTLEAQYKTEAASIHSRSQSHDHISSHRTTATTATSMSTSHATSQPIQSSNSDESQEAKFMQTVIPPKTRDRSLSRSPEKLEANKSMRELSDFLITSGLPPLPERIFESKLPEPMAKSLNMGVGHLLQEYHRRGQIIQQLVGKLSDADRREEDWEIKLKEVEEKSKNQTSQESSMVEGLQTNLDRMVNKSKDMAGDLELSKAEAADLKARYEALKKQIEKESSDADMLKKQLHNVLEKMEKQRERNERSFEAIAKQHQKFRRDPSKSGIDRMTLEVVDVYERKLESVQNELNSMRLMLKSQKSKENVEEESPVTPPPESEQEDENEHDATFTKKPRKLVEDIGDPQGDESIRLRVTMEQQIKLLQKRLDETNALLAKSENEKELLKLELLQFRKPQKALSAQESGSRQRESEEEEKLSTREKIRRDKLNYKLRLYKIDEMNAERCRNYLKDICIRLDINDINQVSTALSEVSKVLHLVPQMQQFIKQVDAIIWAHQHAVLNVTVDQKADGSNPNPPMHKLRDTIKALQIWSEELETLDGLRKFIEKIYRLLRLNDNDDEDVDVKALCVEEIKRLIAFEKNTHRAERSKMKESEESTYTRIVNHFCNLFEITTLSGVFPKMNELYVFVSEVDVGLKRIRELLELDQNVKVSTILTKAADQILIALSNAQSQQPHRPLDTFRNRSHLSDVQNKSSSSALTSLESLLERVSSEHTKKTILDELELEGFGRDKVDREIREEIRMRAERERQEERVNERSKVD